MSKFDDQKIREWAESLQHTDPNRWQELVQRTMSMRRCNEAEAPRLLILSRIAACQVEKMGIPQHVKWSGRDSDRDRECTRCTVLETGGKMRYLGCHCFGTEKVAKVWYDEEGEEVSGDVEVPSYLHCWRCNICGNEDTDDWFL